MQKLKILLAAALSMLLMVSTLPIASAQPAPSGSGLSISPTNSQFTIKPGGSDHLTITLKNITVDDVIAKGTVNDFTSDDSTGNPKLLKDTAAPTPNSIKKFVSNIDDVTLAKGQQKNIILGLDVPKDTPPGAYWGVIRYRAVPAVAAKAGPGQVALTASVGTIVLITVPGNIRQQVRVNGIDISRGARSGSFFVKPPTSVGIDINNFGNGFIAPFGTVEIHDMFNKTVTTYQFNNPKQLGNILPNSRRVFTNDIKGISKIGRYTVTASVSYGNGSQVLTLSKNFWYIPLWLIIIFLLIIAALVYLAYRAYHHYRREEKHSHRR